MPLPLGHTAIGLCVHDIGTGNDPVRNRLISVIFVTVLANLPDIDVVVGLLLKGNGHAFHRGPTHSLVFALLMGLMAANAWKLWQPIPKLHFTNCFLIILSHIAADFFLTSSDVSFFWPLEVNWAAGYCGWRDVIIPTLLEAFQNAGIIAVCGGILLLNRLLTPRRYLFSLMRHLRAGRVQEEYHS